MSGARHSYKARNFPFAERLLKLRERAGWTQQEVARQMHVATRSIRNWEGGSYYPTDGHLKMLIELYFAQNVFPPEREQEEVRALWHAFQTSTRRYDRGFDEQWFAALLNEREARSAGQRQQAERSHPQPGSPEQPLSEALPALTPADDSFPRFPAQRAPRSGLRSAPDVSSFYGRTDEVAELEHWLLVDQCRLVAVLGMGGIGKTALAAKLVRQVAPHFACVLWRSLHNAPSLQDVLDEWLPLLSGRQDNTYAPHEVDQRLSFLIELLQERRCLLVLDNLETLFQEGAPGGRYREGYEAYGDLIREVARTTHPSCLLLTCREKFPDLGELHGRRAPVRAFRLGSLDLPASRQLLQDKDLFGEQGAFRDLVQRYAGNPLALKIVGETVYELFGGNIAAFLARNATTFHEIRQLLTQQFERLSGLEQGLMYWLAISRELTELGALEKDLQPPPRRANEAMEAMQSLYSRSLVERGEHGAFTLQPVVLEYVTERLVAQVGEEIRESRPALLLTHALLQAQAKEYIRASQANLILKPLLNQLVSHFGAPRLEDQLEILLKQVRGFPRAKQGYGGGNVVNLLVRLNGLKGKDCSGLSIWQADLQWAEAQGATFEGSDLTGSVFMRPVDGIVSVALSPNGQYVAGGTNNGEIRLWQATDGQLLLAFKGHIKLTWSLAFNPASTHLVSGGYDGLVKVWEVSSGQCVSILQGHTKWVEWVAVHPAGRLLATCSDDRSIRLWDLSTSRCIKIWPEQHQEVWSVAFSPDGRWLSSSYGDGVVKIWDHASGQCLWSVAAHHGSAVTCLAFSPDSQLLCSGGEDATIMVWQASNGDHLGTLSGHTDAVQCLGFNAQGVLASGSFDRTVKLWQLGKVGHTGEAAQCVGTLRGHTGWVWSTAFGPSGLLASGGQDCTVKLWHIDRGGEGGKCLQTLHGYSRLINTVAFSPDGERLISAENNGYLRMWETKSGQCLHSFLRQTGESSAVAWSADGRLFAQSLPDNTIEIWDVANWRCLRKLEGHQRGVWSVIFSADGHFLASGSADTTIKRWDVESGSCLTTFQGHHVWVWSVACSLDGTLLASGDVDGVVKLWEVSSGQCLRTLHGSPKAIVALLFTPDGTRLLSSNAQDLVTTWDVQSGKCLETASWAGDTYCWPCSVTFSGNLLATASSDQTVKLWDVRNGQLLRSFPCHPGQPWPVALSADQRLLACGMDDGTIMLWERQTGKCLMTLRGERPYERMNITDVTGVTEAQKASLKTLGAIEIEGDTLFSL